MYDSLSSKCRRPHILLPPHDDMMTTYIQHGTKTNLTEVFKLRTTLLLMQNNMKGLEKQQLGASKEGKKE